MCRIKRSNMATSLAFRRAVYSCGVSGMLFANTQVELAMKSLISSSLIPLGDCIASLLLSWAAAELAPVAELFRAVGVGRGFAASTAAADRADQLDLRVLFAGWLLGHKIQAPLGSARRRNAS